MGRAEDESPVKVRLSAGAVCLEKVKEGEQGTENWRRLGSRGSWGEG